MKIRDMECRKTQMQMIVENGLPMCNLQGFFIGNSLHFAGFEAIDMEDSPIDSYNMAIPIDSIYHKICFCKQYDQQCKFFILLHKREESQLGYEDNIYVKEFDLRGSKLVGSDFLRLNETQFLRWWKQYSEFRQVKQYRPDAQGYLQSSYFDNLLAKDIENGCALSWTFNIDGFLYDPQCHSKITAIIENRISNKLSVEQYDPGRFFMSDTTVWNALKNVAEKMKIPLILCTYSRMNGSENRFGAAIIDSVTNGLRYRNNIPPYKNVIDNLEHLRLWLQKNLNT